jgi:hypothetical protein
MLKNVFISGNFNAAFCGWVYVLTAKTLIPLHGIAVVFKTNNFQNTHSDWFVRTRTREGAVIEKNSRIIAKLIFVNFFS